MRIKAPVLLLILLAFSVGLTACDLLDSAGISLPQASTSAENSLVSQQPTAESVPGATPSPVFGTAVAPTPEISELIVWIPPDIATRTEDGAAVLDEQIRTFDARYPSLTIRVEQKVVSGPGGILSYLRTGKGVAPTVLPDLIALPSVQVSAATSEQLIMPLDTLIDEDEIEPIFSSMLDGVRVEDQTMAYPFAVNRVPHLVVNTSTVTETLPLDWNTLITLENTRMSFGAGGEDGAMLAMQFYLDLGGQLTDDTGKAILQAEPLADALEMIANGRDSGFLTTESRNLSTYGDVWQTYTAGTAGLARTVPDYFLTQRDSVEATDYTVTPGVDRPAIPLVSGWAWAVTSSDPDRQILVAELLAELVSAENLGLWSLEADLLPARIDAFEQWPSDDTYVTFMTQELERGVALSAVSQTILPVLEDAVFDVFSGAALPTEAAQQAVEKLATP